MRRPHWHSALLTAVSGIIGLAILAGCSTRHSGLSASDESARYLQSARGRYPIPGPPGDPWGPYIREASTRFDVPDRWIRALMRQESGGNLYRNGRLITSHAGAMGLMQVMPGTYRELRARHNLGADPFEPRDNIMAGVAYMREMYDIYGAPGFLAAYNAGPNRLDDYLSNQRGLPDETRKYIAAIGPSLNHASPRVRSPAEQYAMNQIPLYIPPGPRFGRGSMPTIQLASAAVAAPVARAAVQPVYAPAQPVYTPAPQPRPVAVAVAPQPVYTPAPVPQGRVLAWEEPAKPVYRPAPRPTVVARAERPSQAAQPRAYAQKPAAQKVTLAMRPTPAAKRGGGFQLISTAVAAEAYPAKRLPVAYQKRTERKDTRATQKSAWKVRASAPAQSGQNCKKDSRGKQVCSPTRL